MNRKLRLPTSIGAALVLGIVVALGIGVPWAFNTGSASPAGSLECSVKTVCAYAAEVEVLRMSSTSNAHAGTPSGSAYGHRVCCSGVSGLGTDCAATPSDIVLSLSATDNAHVASDGSYTTDVCVSGEGDDATADCTYTTDNCDADYACLATISGSTNAHVADCDGVDDYATKVCCLVTPDNCPDVSNPGQENSDGDEWGDACDNCPATTTVWEVPPGDTDCDGFTDAVESVVGTDPDDACPDALDDDAWPPDLNAGTGCGEHDGKVNILDVLCFRGKLAPNPYDRRYDLNGDGSVNILDVLLYKPFINTSCANP